MKILLITTFLALATVGLVGCTPPKLALPAFVRGDVSTCSVLGYFGKSPVRRQGSYLDELDLNAARLKDDKFYLGLFQGQDGVLAQDVTAAVKADIESITGSKFIPIDPSDSVAYTSMLIEKARNGQTELDVYKSSWRAKSSEIYNTVGKACDALEAEYPKEKYQINN